MANKEIENKPKTSMVKIAFIQAKIKEGEKILDEMITGNSIYEYAIHESELTLKLDDNGIDKNGNRFDLETKEVISIKGQNEKPSGMVIAKGNKKSEGKEDR